MPSPESVLFLDIDGVLNDHRAIVCRPNNLLLPQCKTLERVLRETGCAIVLSSSWRYVVEPAVMQAWLRIRGVPSARVIGRTATGAEMGLPIVKIPGASGALMYAGECRGDEIAQWIEKHGLVGRFAIVDDEADMGTAGTHVVWTAGAVGLTADDGDALIAMLEADD